MHSSARRPNTRAPLPRQRGLHTLLALSATLALGWCTKRADAQVAIDAFRPTPVAADGFAVSRPVAVPHLGWNGTLWFDYAKKPLTFTRGTASGDQKVEVIRDHLVTHAGMALGVAGIVTVGLDLPVHAWMRGEDDVAPFAEVDGPGLGDVAFLVRAVADKRRYGVGVELVMRMPTANLSDDEQAYSGDASGSFEPSFLLEARGGVLALGLRAGARLRGKSRLVDIDVSHEAIYALTTRLSLGADWHAHAELYGSTSITEFARAENSPLELLVGLKQVAPSWSLGVAAGPGFLDGYSTPRFRIVGTLGVAIDRSEEKAPPPPPPPRDGDGDGILDEDDECPDNAEDDDGFEDDDGCPDVDDDQDGLTDDVDRCRTQPEDTDGFEDEDGCPESDNDRDGVRDEQDGCPEQAEDVDGFEDEDGCPEPDNDKDGFPDADDACPNEPGNAETQGCPLASLDKSTGQITIRERVEFATGKATLLPSSENVLSAVAATFTAHPELVRVRVEGHTDDKGRDRYNLKLSARRAQSVVLWLKSHGVPAQQLEAYGCGETMPRVRNESEETRRENRRVEFHIIDPAPATPRDSSSCQAITR
jgi:outer membrane protein OmpA-like peptidoglycan-associated protein